MSLSDLLFLVAKVIFSGNRVFMPGTCLIRSKCSFTVAFIVSNWSQYVVRNINGTVEFVCLVCRAYDLSVKETDLI